MRKIDVSAMRIGRGSRRFGWILAFMCALAWPLNAEILNLNRDMELGRPGDGVPGYFLEINNVSRVSVVAAPGKRYLLRTVAAGNPGQAVVEHQTAVR